MFEMPSIFLDTERSPFADVCYAFLDKVWRQTVKKPLNSGLQLIKIGRFLIPNLFHSLTPKGEVKRVEVRTMSWPFRHTKDLEILKLFGN